MARIDAVAIVSTLSFLGIILELVRQRKLAVGYSLLWLLTAVVLFVLSLWRPLLDVLARLVGIFYPPTALFVVGFGFVLLILLQFSIVTSKLAHESKLLAEQIALLNWKLEDQKRAATQVAVLDNDNGLDSADGT